MLGWGEQLKSRPKAGDFLGTNAMFWGKARKKSPQTGGWWGGKRKQRAQRVDREDGEERQREATGKGGLHVNVVT